jgi:hypothetical protein
MFMLIFGIALIFIISLSLPTFTENVGIVPGFVVCGGLEAAGKFQTIQ